MDFRTTVLRVGDGMRVGEGILARGGEGVFSGSSRLRRGDDGSAVLAAFSSVPVLPPGDEGAFESCEAFRR